MPYPGLFFIRVSRSNRHRPTITEQLGQAPASLRLLARDPDDDGREWVDVWFDEEGAEALARRWELAAGDEASAVAQVVSIGELLAAGGYAAVGRALAAVETPLLGRIEELKAGVRAEDLRTD